MKKINLLLIWNLLFISQIISQSIIIDPHKITSDVVIPIEVNSNDYEAFTLQSPNCFQSTDWLQWYQNLYSNYVYPNFELAEPSYLHANALKKASLENVVSIHLFDKNVQFLKAGAFSTGLVKYDRDNNLVDQTKTGATPLIEKQIICGGMVIPSTLKDEEDYLLFWDPVQTITDHNRINQYKSMRIYANEKLIVSNMIPGQKVSIKKSDLCFKTISCQLQYHNGIMKEFCFNLVNDPVIGLGQNTLANYQIDFQTNWLIDPTTDWLIHPYTGVLIDPNILNDYSNYDYNEIESFLAILFPTSLGNPSYAINPLTGNIIDPKTGFDIDPNSGFLLDPISDNWTDSENAIQIDPHTGFIDYDNFNLWSGIHPGFTTQCNPAPNYTISIKSELTYEDQFVVEDNNIIEFQNGLPIINQFTDPQYLDYILYSSDVNPAVYEGPKGDDPHHGYIEASVFVNPNRANIKHPIIICDGIDFLSNRTSDIMLDKAGGHMTLQQIFDNGYDLIIADFKGGADYIQKNAFALIELIETLKEDYNIEEIPAIVGPSMGGQVVRYALLYYENYLNEDHDVNVFVSADSPWRGANASTGVQAVAELMKNHSSDILMINKLSNSPAARQMLSYHVNGGNMVIADEACYPIYHYSPSEHSFKSEIDKEYESMGDYPREVKSIIATADGSNGGGDLMAYLNEENFPIPGDFLIEGNIRIGHLNLGNVVINAIGPEVPIVHYEGLLDCIFYDQIKIGPVIVNGVANYYDSCPGSPFELENELAGFGVENGGSISARLYDVYTHIANPSFIPTTSALAIQTSNLFQDIKSEDVFVFDAFYMDDIDSAHNDLYNPNGEPIEFIIDEVNKENDIQESSHDPCDYIFNNFSSNPVIFDESQFIFEYPCPSSIFSDPIMSGSIQSCLLNSEFFNFETNESVQFEPELKILNNPCNTSLNMDDGAINFTFFSLTEPCTIELDICTDIDLACWDYDVPCQEIQIQLIPIDCFENPNGANVNHRSKASNFKIDHDQIPNIEIFPNPTNQNIQIQLPHSSFKINLIRIDGKIIETYLTNQSLVHYKLDHPPGTYIVECIDLKYKTTSRKKLIIQ